MSRSRKDGRRGGAHRNTQGKEFWSARPTRYLMADKVKEGRACKRNTHRCERRQGKREVLSAWTDAA